MEFALHTVVHAYMHNTPVRTHSISGLKSRVMKLSFLSLTRLKRIESKIAREDTSKTHNTDRLKILLKLKIILILKI